MKKFILLLASAMLAAGCAQNIEFADPTTMNDASEIVSETVTRSLDGAVYNEIVDAWMVPQPDPYTLANFQAAYDKLAAGKSTQALSKAQAAEFTPTKKLAPTHYALKIYPKTEEEQWRVETMEDVQVAYIPFDWVQLTPQEAGKVEQAKTRSAANTFPEKSPYTVTHDYTHVSDGDSTDPRTYQLPILYTVWPASKPLPSDLEHVVDYEVFLPLRETDPRFVKDSSSDTKFTPAALSAIENEAVQPAAGYPASAATRNAPLNAAPQARGHTGKLVTLDNTLNVDVPMANLKVRHQTGSNIYETKTAFDGSFSINYDSSLNPPSFIPTSITIVYQDVAGKWTITQGAYNIPRNVTAFVDVSLTSPFPVNRLESDSYQTNEIHRAVNYFFNVQSVFTKPNWPGGINITAHATPNPDDPQIGGYFGTARHEVDDITVIGISIFNPNLPHSAIGSTFHELGHYAHFGVLGYHDFYDVNLMLQESFASYAGWYLCKQYYNQQGLAYSDALNISNNGRQQWRNIHTRNNSNSYFYTPLFVDLTDTFNQNPQESDLNDVIQNTPASYVWDVMINSRTWADCKSGLRGYAGPYYSTGQINAVLDYYDSLFTLNTAFLP